MKNKESIVQTILIIILLTVFVIPNHVKAETDEKTILEQILLRIQSPKADETGKMQDLAGQLWKFSEEYPDSRFADDARFIHIFTVFIGAITNKDDTGAFKSIQNMRDLLARYPNGRIEESIIQQFSSLFFFLNIPYKYILSYMEGIAGNFETQINNFNSIKDDLDYSKDSNGKLALQLYGSLGAAYLSLKKYTELYKLMEEAKEKFPNNAELIKHLEKFMEIAEKSKIRDKNQ